MEYIIIERRKTITFHDITANDFICNLDGEIQAEIVSLLLEDGHEQYIIEEVMSERVNNLENEYNVIYL